ncbi:MAG: aminotransferase class I/II-fold pyridoxal phosphate-dependent enzyme [Planctomycetota bacterium]
MTRAAIEHDAINLAQGFPDFEGPPEILDLAREAMAEGHNQYARSMGHPLLVESIARRYEEHYGLRFDPLTEVMVTSGATEALAASLLGLLEPGDEVLVLEPFYDSYPAVIAMALGSMQSLTLCYPGFHIDLEALSSRIGPATRMLLMNTPHNPCGRVFGRAELSGIAELCQQRDLIVVCDEVYEHLWFDEARHVPIATLPGMRERTLTLSSTGKTFSLTGWKIGWAVGPAKLVQAAAAAHQFLTFATATPLQVAMARALDRFRGEYLDAFRAAYLERRDLLSEILEEAGFSISRPEGTYFVIADYGSLSDEDDFSLAHRLIREHGVAACPTSSFYVSSGHGGTERKLLRFAFCKERATLEAARGRLKTLRS